VPKNFIYNPEYPKTLPALLAYRLTNGEFQQLYLNKIGLQKLQKYAPSKCAVFAPLLCAGFRNFFANNFPFGIRVEEFVSKVVEMNICIPVFDFRFALF
jgi:hypothetical protein